MSDGINMTDADLVALIDARMAEREAKARSEAEEAEHESERARQAELAEHRRLRVATDERMVKDHLDLRDLTDRLDRERQDAIAKFWRERNG